MTEPTFTSFDKLSADLERAISAVISVWFRAEGHAADRVSPSQLRALEEIRGPGTMNLRTLAERLGMIPSSASRLCARLRAAGLVDRAESTLDRRQIVLRLTQTGLRLVGELSAHRRRDLAEILTRMTPNGREALLHGLQEFIDASTETTPAGRHRREHAR